MTEWSTLIGRDCRGLALIGRELHRTEIFACSSLVLYDIRESWFPCTERPYYYYRRFSGCDEMVLYGIRELVLYGIRELAKQHHDLGPDLGSRVLHSGV